MSKNVIGCLAVTGIVSLILLCIGGVLIYTAPGLAAKADTIAAMEQQSFAAIDAAAPGQDVIAHGQIDPETPTQERGLAMYESERYERETTRDSDGRRRTSYEWNDADRYTPSFALLTPDEQLIITDDSYDLDTPTFDEPGENEVGNLRYEGFKPGDNVLVVGKTAGGGIDAETVFGGTQEEYVAALRDRSASNRRWGTVLLGFGLLPGLVMVGVLGLFVVRGRRSSMPTVTDADGSTVPEMTFSADTAVAEADRADDPSTALASCPNCGASLAGDATFCGNCGSRISLPTGQGSA